MEMHLIEKKGEDAPPNPRDLLPGMAPLPLCLLIACAWLFVRGVLMAAPGISLFVVVTAFCGVCLWYRRQSAPIAGLHLPGLAYAMLLALSCLLLENAGARWFVAFTALLSAACWQYAAFTVPKGEGIPASPLTALFRAVLERPAQHAGACLRRLTKGTKRATVLWVLAGIAVSVPLLCVVISLLMGADGRFATMVLTLEEMLVYDLRTLVLRALITLLLGWYLAAMVYGARHASQSPSRLGSPPLPRMPVPFSSAVITLPVLLYAAFCAVQCQSVASVFSGKPLEGFSYSEYAREGFFELCSIAIINLIIFAAVQCCTKQKPAGLRMLLSLLGALTLCLIMLAGLKMGMYMHQYGLTLLRVYTTGFMVLLFVLFLLLTIAQWRRLSLAKGIALACLTAVAVLAFANIPGQVARYNVARYVDGSHSAFDMEQYASFPYAAAPHLARLHDETDEADLQKDIETLMTHIVERQNDLPLYGKSVQRIASEGLANDFLTAHSIHPPAP